MKRAFGIVVLTVALLGSGGLAARAADAPAAPGVKAEILRQIDEAEQKLVALGEATPAEKYGWRPGAGVRSTGEALMHVAQGNYFLPTLWGTKPPAGVDVRGLDKDAGDKAKTLATLKQSFAHVRGSIQATPDADLEKPVKLFDHEGTRREAFLLVATHAHEHLGQEIAYARMNGIVPPWTAAEQAEQQKQQKKKGEGTNQ
jgi:uncharacterized damage-inducible protein DinB